MATLLSFISDVYLKRHLNVSEAAAEQLRVAVRLLDKSMGRSARLQDLDESLLFSFAAWLKANGRSAATINSRVSSILSLWREAARLKLADPVPEVIPKIHEPRHVPRAWQIEELERLLRAAKQLRGEIRGWPIRRRDWWLSLLMFLYDSGARVGAALSVHWGEVDLAERTVLLTADSAKTEYEQLIVVSDQTSRHLARIRRPPRELVWPSAVRREAIYQQLKRLLVQAGLPTDRRCMFHRLRKTNATWSARCGSIELAQKQLGHRSPQITIDHYIDPRIVRSIQAAEILPRPRVG